MKKYYKILAAIMVAALSVGLFTACARKKDDLNEVIDAVPEEDSTAAKEGSAEETPDPETKENTEEDETESSTGASDETEADDEVSSNKAKSNADLSIDPVPGIDKMEKNKAQEALFEYTLDYLKDRSDLAINFNFEKNPYTVEKKRDTSLEIPEVVEKTDKELNSLHEKRIAATREDRSGTIMDCVVYSGNYFSDIKKIVTTEFGSSGREITEYYYDNNALVYVYQYVDDIYGTTLNADKTLPGIKAVFKNDAMSVLYNYDSDKKKNISYSAKDYKKYDKLVQGEYDNYEKVLLNKGYTVFNSLRCVPAAAKVTGYVSDEQGGVLANATCKIVTAGYDHTMEVVTNGDGYFEVNLPANLRDWYNITCTYGDFEASEVDDIAITPMTTQYSAGVIYMAPKGENVHDRARYLMNVISKPSSKLGDNEYEIVLTYDKTKADLSAYGMNLKDKSLKKGEDIKIKVDNDGAYKCFVVDNKNGSNGNNNSIEMSLSDALLTVYDKDGIVAAYPVPVNKPGVVWEVCEIKDGRVVIANNYYPSAGKDYFFE